MPSTLKKNSRLLLNFTPISNNLHVLCMLRYSTKMMMTRRDQATSRLQYPSRLVGAAGTYSAIHILSSSHRSSLLSIAIARGATLRNACQIHDQYPMILSTHRPSSVYSVHRSPPSRLELEQGSQSKSASCSNTHSRAIRTMSRIIHSLLQVDRGRPTCLPSGGP